MKIKIIFLSILITFVLSYSNLLGMAGESKKVSVLIVGHGAPASDFPKLKEYFKLHESHSPEAEKIENELRNWPRNEENDPYWAGFIKIVEIFRNKFKNFHSVHYAFNEMCAPTVEEALNKILLDNPDLILVTSIMFTPGGGHSEKDIPAAIEIFQEEHPEIRIIYAWPYSQEALANFINAHLIHFVEK
ncbi:sirohydrochlorin chelatase [Melioribacter sp. OK-6-Me]|uniref:sirohydrochlorin chelatase n=1 Tax=unclassified Melioribacter TaxID=2627329 RepID=UPI003EDAF8B0